MQKQQLQGHRKNTALLVRALGSISDLVTETESRNKSVEGPKGQSQTLRSITV